MNIRFKPLNLFPNRQAPNRVVVPPMASQTADADGKVTQSTLAHYKRLAGSGAGTLMVEYTFVDETGRSEPNQLGASSNSHISGLTTLASTLKRGGRIVGLQLTHAGGKTDRDMTLKIMGPSSVPVPVKAQTMPVPAPMTTAEIEQWKQWFLSAAGRAAQSGFDFIELHSAHGYGLNQWLSPITNKRTDDYGGNLKNRARMLLEITRKTKEAYPALGISVRLPGKDNAQEGLTLDDMKQVVSWLDEAGVDIINVSSGIGGWRRPKEKRGEGYLVAEAREIKKVTRKPVIGVGGIVSKEYIEHALSNDFLSLAAVGRAILKNPAKWGCLNLCQNSA